MKIYINSISLKEFMKKTNKTFYCFSPPVMIATFFIEIALVMYTLLFRKLNTSTKIGVVLIICLAIFQLAEYGVCESYGQANYMAKLGFIAITLLPPLGLHLVTTIGKRDYKPLIIASYTVALAWIALFVFGSIMSGSVCEGNYVIFNIAEPYEGIYYLYYNFLLLLAMGLAISFAQKKRNPPKNIRKALHALVFGYLAFIVPSIFFTLINDYKGNDSQLPSVMCGFAVTLALVLALRTIPLTSQPKD